MNRDIRRILLRLGILAGCVSLFLLIHRYSPDSVWGIAMVVPIGLATVFLIMGIFAAGTSAPALRKGNTTIHRPGWGATVSLVLVSGALAALFPFALTNVDRFWFWFLSGLGAALGAYFVAVTLLYRARCDERLLCIRSWGFRWTCHEWDDLVSIYRDDDQLRLLFSRTDYAELPGFLTAIDHIHAVARAALQRNDHAMPDDDDA